MPRQKKAAVSNELPEKTTVAASDFDNEAVETANVISDNEQTRKDESENFDIEPIDDDELDRDENYDEDVEGPEEVEADPIQKESDEVKDDMPQTPTSDNADDEKASEDRGAKQARIIRNMRLTEKQREEANKKREVNLMTFSQLQSAMREKTELTGEVISVTPLGDEAVVATVLWRNFTISIPCREMYQTYPIDESTIRSKNDRIRRERQMLIKFLGAKIIFIVTNIEGDSRNCAIAGSRKMACERRAIRNYDIRKGSTPQVNIGDMIEAQIINVGIHGVRANIQGLDTQISTWQLSNRYMYKPGETLKVIVEDITYDEKGHATAVSVSARSAETPEFRNNLSKLKYGEVTRGRITSMNQITTSKGPATRVFMFLESFNVPAVSTYYKVDTFAEPPIIGDTVLFSVRNKNEEKGYAQGTIMRKF